jgi:prohibitin 2
MIVVSIILVVTGLILLFVAKANENQDVKKPVLISGFSAFVLAVVFFILSLIYTVDPGEVGVEILLGKVVKYAPSGMSIKNPFAGIVKMDLRTKKAEMKLEGASKDLQEINIELAINYRLNYEKISELYNTVGIDYEVIVINPAVMNLAKAAVSQFAINDVIVKRNDLSKLIFESLKDRLAQYYIILETVNLNNISFQPAFSAAVQEKQVQEQGVQTALYKKQQAMQEADQRVVMAKADAEVTRLNAIAESEKQRLLRNTVSKDVIELKWIERWDGKLPQYMLGNSVPMVNMPANAN